MDGDTIAAEGWRSVPEPRGLPEAGAATESKAVTGCRSAQKPIRLLLVEDSVADAELFLYLLAETGLEVETHVAKDLTQARRLLERPWDLVVLDLHLPESRGIDTIDRLQEMAVDLPPLVVMSGIDDRSTHDESIRRGVQDFLVKGKVTPRAVGRVLRHALERGQYEQALVEAQKRLASAERLEAVGQLAGGVAHDFNNMLSIILGAVDLALEDDCDDQSELLQDARHAAVRARNLTRRLLAFASRQVLEAQTFDLRQLVREMLPLLQRSCGEAIELCLDLSDAVAMVETDSSQMEQVLMNLLVNARDALKGEGKIEIRIANVASEELPGSVLRHVGGRDQVLLRFRDNGPGVPPEILDRVFDPFVTSKPQGEGTGLGLATVYGIVKQSGGHVTIESKPNRGTTVYIYLPRRGAEEWPLAPTAARPATAEIALPSAIGRRILLVEDEVALRNLMSRILKSLGYEVLEALDPHHAVELCCDPKLKIDLLLSDVVMPGMDGRALLVEARRVRPGLPALLVSGYSSHLAEEGVGSGFSFLPKPLSKEALAEKLSEILDRRPAGNEALSAGVDQTPPRRAAG